MALFKFLTKNKDEVRESHMHNLILMAKSDNSIDKSEIEAILSIGQEQGFTEDEVKKMILTDLNPKAIIIPEEEHEMFKQLHNLSLVMCADGIIENDEMEFVTDFATQLGFRKTSSAFIVDRILEGIEEKLSIEQIYQETKIFMKRDIE